MLLKYVGDTYRASARYYGQAALRQRRAGQVSGQNGFYLRQELMVMLLTGDELPLVEPLGVGQQHLQVSQDNVLIEAVQVGLILLLDAVAGTKQH
ncbi:MAG: hypothetical protein EOO62_35355 [Hymenobacter sp.]|nr:MAG: hypothetical protein EOO62_35355 [Hymenobacter sp.]